MQKWLIDVYGSGSSLGCWVGVPIAYDWSVVTYISFAAKFGSILLQTADQSTHLFQVQRQLDKAKLVTANVGWFGGESQKSIVQNIMHLLPLKDYQGVRSDSRESGLIKLSWCFLFQDMWQIFWMMLKCTVAMLTRRTLM